MIENYDRPCLRSATVHVLPALAGDVGETAAPFDLPAAPNVRVRRGGRPVVILIIDPRLLTRESIAHWLGAHAREFRILTLASPIDAVDELGGDVDLAVLNIGGALVSDPAVCEVIGQLNRLFPDVPIALFADRDECSCITEALRRGVRAYIPTSLSLPVVVEALRLVRAGGTFIPAAAFMGTPLQDDPPSRAAERPDVHAAEFEGFTPRQLEVLDLLRRGKPNKIIAYELRMQESTVKVHVRHIMMKLKASNRTQAVFLANQLLDVKPKAGMNI